MDPEVQVKKIIALGPQKVQEDETKLIMGYPNTYTFTKSLTERALKKLHGNLKTSIVRPSIIISCYEDPFPGWIDTMSAGGGITYAVNIGLMHHVKAKK